ncbi:EAL domain-containing protein [Thermomicrobium sp.]
MTTWGEGRSWLTVHLAAQPGLQEFLQAALERLTEEELDSTQALVGTAASPLATEIPSIEPLRRLAAALESIWFEELLANGQLTCAFQPIANASDRRIAGYEALLRARRPDGTILNAAVILRAARALDRITALDVRARILALEQAKKHELDGLLFIDFTPSAIYDPTTCLQTTWAAAEQLRIDPGKVVFEVIESESLTNLRHAANLLAASRQHGFRVALDDIGSAHSGLVWLSALQPDFVKIDRQLTAGLAADAAKRAIVAKLAELCRQIGARTIAEGLEDEADASVAVELGVDFLQGYLFGHPQIPEEMSTS